ncbi:MAG: 4Fe-4S binding protein [Bryobacter sp.]|nr:4Fe-4S binding protein [Bryobacter sp.]
MVKEGAWGKFAHDVTHRGVSAWLLAGLLLGFYYLLYYTETFTPWGKALGLGSKWGFYGMLYTLAVLGGGAYMLRRYKHNRYQIVRTSVVMFVQFTFAFATPLLLKAFQQPEYYFSYLWPLKFDYFNPYVLFNLPLPMLLYSVVGSLVMVPLLAVFFGKRWYCSWVCGCGGLANTTGEPWRHLSDKSTASWRFERVAIYSVLGLCVVLTLLLFVSFGIKNRIPELTKFITQYQYFYGLLVVTWLSGILGVVLYPINGTRVWCRFFCPMAALLGVMHKVGRFQIRVKDNMCISCGMCSTYCEMGIDVRAYAQANQSFTRASCVGCGMCAEVCPRGVLRLENVSKPQPQFQPLVQITLR